MCPDPTNWTRSSSSNEEPGRILAKIHAAIPRRFLTTKDLESESLTSPLKNDDKMCETFDVDFGKKCDSICANPQEASEFGGLNIKHLIDEVPDVWRGYTRPFKGKTDSDTAYPVSQGGDTKEQASTTLSAPPQTMMGDEPNAPPVDTLESEGTTEKQVKPDAEPAQEQEKKTGTEQQTEGKEGAEQKKKAKKVQDLEDKTETLVKQVEEDEERVRKDINAIVEDKKLVKEARKIVPESEESKSDIQDTINNTKEAETIDKKEKVERGSDAIEEEERGSDTIEDGERRSETQTEPKKGADVLTEAQANLKEDTDQLKRDTEQLNQDVEKLDQTEKELTREESEEEEVEQASWWQFW